MTTANRNRNPNGPRSGRSTVALTAAIGSLLLSAVPSQRLQGQARTLRPEISAGVVLVRGLIGRVTLPVPITRHIVVTSGADLVRMRKGGCLLIDSLCLERPATEFIGSAGFALGLQASSRARPRIEVGVLLVHRFSADLPDGDRRTLPAPSIEAGIRPPAPWGRWSLAIRWRWLDRSRLEGGISEVALLLGLVVPGKDR